MHTVRVFAIAAIALACRGQLSESDIERWKRSERRGQIALAFTAESTPYPIRLRAARALVELAADAHFSAGLKKLDKDTRSKIARDLGADLARLLAAPDLASQVLAKDFLGLLILAGDVRTAERSGSSVVQWITSDFQTRLSLGKVSGVELLKRIGTPALPALHALLRPPHDLLVLAKVIVGIGDQDAIRHASDLVARAASSQGPQIPERTLRALGALASAESAYHLARMAADDQIALRARRIAAEEMRVIGHRAPLEIAARLGLDPVQDLYVRESCLVYLEKVCDARCGAYLGDLWKILKERGLRIEAASAIVKIGGTAALPQLLKRLPPGDYADKEIATLARDIERNVGAGALPSLRGGIGARGWPGRILAIRALGLLGTEDDADRLEKLAADKSRPPGWKGTTSLGDEARRAAQQIRARKKSS